MALHHAEELLRIIGTHAALKAAVGVVDGHAVDYVCRVLHRPGVHQVRFGLEHDAALADVSDGHQKAFRRVGDGIFVLGLLCGQCPGRFKDLIQCDARKFAADLHAGRWQRHNGDLIVGADLTGDTFRRRVAEFVGAVVAPAVDSAVEAREAHARLFAAGASAKHDSVKNRIAGIVRHHHGVAHLRDGQAGRLIKNDLGDELAHQRRLIAAPGPVEQDIRDAAGRLVMCQIDLHQPPPRRISFGGSLIVCPT